MRARSPGQSPGTNEPLVTQGAPEEPTDELWTTLYGRLKALAHKQLQSERAGHTLNTTALVHEAYLRLFDQRSLKSASATQLLASATTAMRRVLIDHARR